MTIKTISEEVHAQLDQAILKGEKDKITAYSTSLEWIDEFLYNSKEKYLIVDIKTVIGILEALERSTANNKDAQYSYYSVRVLLEEYLSTLEEKIS